MSEFQKRTNEDGEPVECDCCNYPAAVSMFKDAFPHTTSPDKWLCDICASTFISNAVFYQRPGREDPDLYRALAWIGNRILESIAGRED